MMTRAAKGQTRVTIAFILAIYLLLTAGVYFGQHLVIFRSVGDDDPPPKAFDIEERYLPTPDGETLYAWWLHSQEAKGTVLFFQENGHNIGFLPEYLTTFRKLGLNALLVDYRGYGRSTGLIRRENDIYTDGDTAWRFLVDEKKITPKDIVIWGRSLGGGVAAEIARRHGDAGGLVLESTFYALDEMARRRFWYLPTPWLLRFHFSNGEKLKRITMPVIIIHSTEDRYIPFSQAARLFDAANAPKTLIDTRGSHLDRFGQNISDLARLKKHLPA